MKALFSLLLGSVCKCMRSVQHGMQEAFNCWSSCAAVLALPAPTLSSTSAMSVSSHSTDSSVSTCTWGNLEGCERG